MTISICLIVAGGDFLVWEGGTEYNEESVKLEEFLNNLEY